MRNPLTDLRNALFIVNNLTHLVKREDQEGPAPAGLYDDGDKLGVDGAERAVPCDPRHSDVVVALVILQRLAEDMTEFARSHNSPEHIWGVDRKGGGGGGNLGFSFKVVTVKDIKDKTKQRILG